ncbi:hypothetical protein AFEL58S_01742 [Afipia felis]
MVKSVSTTMSAARHAQRFGFALVISIAATVTGAAQTEETPEDYPAGPGRDDTFYTCTACHGFKLVAQQGMNRRQWDESINLMIARHGMPEPEAKDREIIINYLEQTFPQRLTPSGGAGGFRNPFMK